MLCKEIARLYDISVVLTLEVCVALYDLLLSLVFFGVESMLCCKQILIIVRILRICGTIDGHAWSIKCICRLLYLLLGAKILFHDCVAPRFI